jgi:hypothetical protein
LAITTAIVELLKWLQHLLDDILYHGDMRENRDGVVKLHDIDEDIFGKILEFLYTGKDVVSEENAEKIFRAASLMQIPCLQATCEEFLLTQVSPDNCIGIWKNDFMTRECPFTYDNVYI